MARAAIVHGRARDSPTACAHPPGGHRRHPTHVALDSDVTRIYRDEGARSGDGRVEKSLSVVLVQKPGTRTRTKDQNQDQSKRGAGPAWHPGRLAGGRARVLGWPMVTNTVPPRAIRGNDPIRRDEDFDHARLARTCAASCPSPAAARGRAVFRWARQLTSCTLLATRYVFAAAAARPGGAERPRHGREYRVLSVLYQPYRRRRALRVL